MCRRSVIKTNEFKVGDGGTLDKIKSEGYHQKYPNQGKDIYLAGSEFEWERG